MKIAIAGYGLEGKASFEYWNTSENEITIVDERNEAPDIPEGVATILGAEAFSHLEGFDVVIRTPGLAPNKIVTDGKIWSATNEFFDKCPAPIIGVTGTKGKGTTCSLIASILHAAGKTVHTVGNIGQPALAKLPEIREQDIVVFELSSFQLWDIIRSPQVAVVLGIVPDHLNVHSDMDDYVEAKRRIIAYQQSNDLVIYDARNDYARSIGEQSPAKQLAYMSDQAGEVKDGYFYYQTTKICPVSSLGIVGSHNQENAAAAISAAWQFTQDIDAVERGLASFTGLPHRLKFIAEKKGVKYYDDSIATTPSAAMAALNSFEGGKVIILGGQSKGASYDELLELCKRTGTKVIAVGDTGRHLMDLCAQYGVICRYVNGLMEEVVAVADEIAVRGDVVLLSPAAASFDQYDNYAARGDQFIEAVSQL